MTNDTAIRQLTATIASGASASAAFHMNGEFAIVGFRVPATWTTANLRIQVSMDPIVRLPSDSAPSTFEYAYDDSGNAIEAVTGVVSTVVYLSTYVGGNYFKLISVNQGAGPSTGSGSTVNQAGARDVIVLYKKV